MSAKITIDGIKPREVLSLNYSIYQETDVEGRPTAISREARSM
ncbi:MAG: hypothetical protein R2750_06195 [Bacteroidales bacterium]